jgi:hypothetical protein
MKTREIIERTCKDEGAEHRDKAAEIAAAIRKRSAVAELVSEEEILSLLRAAWHETGEDIAAILIQLIEENKDLYKLSGAGSQFFYSTIHMTETYATILLNKMDGPMRLIAETVRQNAHVYQRPVLLDIFTKPPFDLTHDQVLEYLKTMAATESYDDIKAASTSASGIYLYSTTHLETEYAVMLAEWLDVGQSDNP